MYVYVYSGRVVHCWALAGFGRPVQETYTLSPGSRQDAGWELPSHHCPSSQDVVNCVGGMGALLPLLERVAVQPQEAEAGPCETHDLVGPELTSGHNTQGLLLPLGKSSGECPSHLQLGERVLVVGTVLEVVAPGTLLTSLCPLPGGRQRNGWRGMQWPPFS